MDNETKAKIVERLKGFDEIQINSYLDTIDRFIDIGVKPGDVYTIGMPPSPDIMQLKLVVTNEQYPKFQTIVSENPDIFKVEIFPIGIVINDLYITDISIR